MFLSHRASREQLGRGRYMSGETEFSRAINNSLAICDFFGVKVSLRIFAANQPCVLLAHSSLA